MSGHEVQHIWGETEEGYQARTDARRKAMSEQRAALQREQTNCARTTELQRLRDEVIEKARVFVYTDCSNAPEHRRAISRHELHVAINTLETFEAKKDKG